MDDVIVRRLGPGEVDEVVRFTEAFDDPIDIVSARTFLADDGHHLVVAYVDARPAGFASATEVLHPDKYGPELFLNEIAVVERSRRRGVGAAMLEALKLLGRERGCRLIWVLTDDDNVAAQALYEKAGAHRESDGHILYEIDLDV